MPVLRFTMGQGFNPRARVGRDAKELLFGDYSPGFNPRARVGRDALCWLYESGRWSFNPRARVGRDHGTMALPRQGGMFQSTRPRGARRCTSNLFVTRKVVSIHAPAWGATNVHGLAMVALTVSIHAPAWGATKYVRPLDPPQGFNPRARVGRDGNSASGMVRTWKFQSTRPRGARPRFLNAWLSKAQVSIHAPAWGATIVPGLSI